MFPSRHVVFVLSALAMAAVATTRSLVRPTVSSADPAVSHADGRVRYRSALFTGTLETRDAAGRVRERAGVHDGLLDGEQARWHADGRPAESRTWRSGAKVGTHRGWWPNGTRQFSCTFADGLPEGTCTDWHENGRVATVHTYVHGEERGAQQGWSARGELQFNYVRRDGRRYGVLGTVRCKTLPVFRDSTLTAEWTSDPTGLHQVGAFTLTDQTGATVTQAALEGKVTVVTFFYATCTDLCPKLRSRLAAVRARFAREANVQVISITVTPEHDTAPLLAAYASANAIAAPGWRLLTGDRREVQRLANEGFFANTPLLRARNAPHGETMWLVDGDRRLRGVYNGTQPVDAANLVRDVSELVAATRGE